MTYGGYRPHLDSALALHAQLPPDGNLPWSPYSVAAALGLAAAGARGRTLDELAGVLAPGGDLAVLGRLLAEAATPAEAEAAVANSLWMRQALEFREPYQQVVRSLPGGALHRADFRGDPEQARGRINEDVAKTTRGLIQDLLAPGVITPETAAVIVNALYLKVAWQYPFPQEATGPAPFHTRSGTRQVPTMRLQERLGHAAADGWRMVTLPTTGDVQADVLLPDRGPSAGSGPDLPELSAATVHALYASVATTRVDLTLPRFRIEAQASLDGPLGRLGVSTAFTRDADFSGITETERIWIDTVVHKAVLRVAEEGLEGAAATAVVMRLASMDLSRPVPFHVDRPFVMIVRHARTGAIYFLARVVEP